MSDQYVGEIRTFGFNFAPVQWATCDGQLLAISSNTALFSLLGTFFGGNGTSNFGLPDMRGNVPLHWGQGTGLSPYVIGQQAGQESVTITSATMAIHNHMLQVAAGTKTNAPTTSTWLGDAEPAKIYIGSGTPNVQLAQSAIGLGPANGGQGHENRQPFLVINFCIALTGIYPPRS